MANPTVSTNIDELSTALAAMAAGGGRIGMGTCSRLSPTLARYGLAGFNLDDSAFAIFKAITESPEALLAACLAHPKEALSRSLEDSAKLSLDIHEPAHFHKDLFHHGLLGGYTPLHFCASADLFEETSILMRFGASANDFRAGVTAIGLCAYVGSARTLCEMIAHGADATLYLIAEHAPAQYYAHGSTLLHRVMARDIRFNKSAIIRILADCERCYPDLNAKTIEGQTPMDWAAGDTRADSIDALCTSIARREAFALHETTPTSLIARSTQRM